MVEISHLAEQMARNTGQPYMHWLEAIEGSTLLAVRAKLGDEVVQSIATTCETPKQFSTIVEAIEAYSKENPTTESGFELLGKYIEYSPYSTYDWFIAIEYFYDWLEQIGQKMSLGAMLSFIGTAQEKGLSPGELPNQPLIEKLTECLDLFGYQD